MAPGSRRHRPPDPDRGFALLGADFISNDRRPDRSPRGSTSERRCARLQQAAGADDDQAPGLALIVAPSPINRSDIDETTSW